METTMTRTCGVCGADVADEDGTSCPVCGADVPAEATDLPGSPRDSLDSDASEPEDVISPTAPAWPVAPPPVAGGGTPPPGSMPPPAPPAPGYGAAPHPSGIPSEYRTWAMLTHLSAFLAAWVAMAFIGPLVMWLIKREEHPFLDHHGKEALNFNLSMLLYLVVGGLAGAVISIVTLGIGLIVVVPLAIAGAVLWIVATIRAAIEANNGRGYRYPLTIRFIAD